MAAPLPSPCGARRGSTTAARICGGGARRGVARTIRYDSVQAPAPLRARTRRSSAPLSSRIPSGSVHAPQARSGSARASSAVSTGARARAPPSPSRGRDLWWSPPLFLPGSDASAAATGEIRLCAGGEGRGHGASAWPRSRFSPLTPARAGPETPTATTPSSGMQWKKNPPLFKHGH